MAVMEDKKPTPTRGRRRVRQDVQFSPIGGSRTKHARSCSPWAQEEQKDQKEPQREGKNGSMWSDVDGTEDTNNARLLVDPNNVRHRRRFSEHSVISPINNHHRRDISTSPVKVLRERAASASAHQNRRSGVGVERPGGWMAEREVQRTTGGHRLLSSRGRASIRRQLSRSSSAPPPLPQSSPLRAPPADNGSGVARSADPSSIHTCARRIVRALTPCYRMALVACLLVLLVALLLARGWPTKRCTTCTTTPKLHDVIVARPPEEYDDCWVYMHMPGSGVMDTEARSALLKRWRGEEVLFDTVEWRRGDEYASGLSFGRWRLAHGGCTETLRRFGGRKCKWFTLFRHPIARLVRAFYHCKDNPGDAFCVTESIATADIDLVTFAEHWGNYALRQFALAGVSASIVKEWARASAMKPNLPSWYLVKEYLGRNSKPDDLPEAALNDLLGPVQGILETRYAAIGIAEELSTTMDLFDKALDIPGVKWREQLGLQIESTVLESTRAESVRQAMNDPRIRHFLALDILLYEHALKIFWKQASSHNVVYRYNAV